MEAAPSELRAAAPGRPRRRAQSWLFTISLLALVLGTVGGVLVARERAVESTERRATEAAERAARLLDAELRELWAGLAGASAVTVGPDLDPEVFAAFGRGVIASGQAHQLALVAVDDGPAPGSTTYSAVAALPAGVVADGADLGADPVRREAFDAAVATRQPTVSGLLEVTIAGQPGVEVVHPLVTGTGEGPVAGVVMTVLPRQRMQDTLRAGLDDGMDAVLLDRETHIVGPELERRDERVAVTLEVDRRSWQVLVRYPASHDLTVAWFVAIGGGAATLAMVALLVLTVRHQRALKRANELLERGEERGRAAQEVAGRLARALTGAEVATALVGHLPVAVGARSAVVASVDPRSGRLEELDPDAGPGSSARRLLPEPEPGSVVATVLAERTPAWLSSPLGWRGDELTAGLARDGSALAVLPLVHADGSGVLAVSYPQFHIFGDDEQALLETVAVLAAQALARGRRYDTEHQTAVAFQRAALPDALPCVEGLAIAARYRPATHGATVGGDWYDVLELDERRVALVVGDVVGHGMEAAAAMGRLRTAFRTIVPFTDDPGEMLAAISQQVESIPDAFCTTVVVAVVDLGSGELTWSRAGHPPPMVVGAGGARLLDEACLPPLGVVPDAPPRVHTTVLAPGDVIVLYTDGIVERRDESLDQGLQRLAIVAEQLVDLAPEELCDALVEALVPAEAQTDDLAVLVVRYDG